MLRPLRKQWLWATVSVNHRPQARCRTHIGPVFTGGHDLPLEEIIPFSWTVHYLVSFRLATFDCPCRQDDRYGFSPLPRLMDPDIFLKTLENFPATQAGDSSEAPTQSARALDQISTQLLASHHHCDCNESPCKTLPSC